MTAETHVDDLRAAIEAAGLTPPDKIVADGNIHRFASNGKPGDDAGWYVAYDGDLPAGQYGCWRAGISETWRAHADNDLSPDQRKEQRNRIRQAQREADKERDQRQAEAARRATEIWRHAEPAPADHSYLQAKGIKPNAAARIHERSLVIPVKCDGEISSLQFIAPDGSKKFLTGGRVAGGYCGIGKPGDVIAICEGFATAASIQEATGYAVAVAFSAGNLESVARLMRQRYPKARLILCGDNDESGTGQLAAGKAAQVVSAEVAIPPEVGDWNDHARCHGLAAVKQAMDTTVLSVSYRRLSDVQATAIDWLWPGRIAKGKVTMIAGNPGLGKSQVGASLSAKVTTGGLWPVDRTRASLGNVIILSAEDDAADTIRPRLEAAGADVSRVYVLDAVRDGDKERPFNLGTDLQRLGGLASSIGDVSLIIIDPISAYLGGTDSHKNADVRALLAPLSKLAADHGAAIVCVSHLNKSGGGDALARVTGSLAFVAAARAAWIACRDPDDQSRRLFLPAKNNIGPDGSGLAYHIESATVGDIETSRISWHAEAVSVSADDALSLPDEERTARTEAGEWLSALLNDEGSMNKREIMKLGKKEGFSERTIQRARADLDLMVKTEGFGKEKTSYWSLPNHANPGTFPGGTIDNNDKSPATQGFPPDDVDQSCHSCQDTGTGTYGTDEEEF